MSEMIEDIEGAEVIIDDILIWGSTLEEHDQRLKKSPRQSSEVQAEALAKQM